MERNIRTPFFGLALLASEESRRLIARMILRRSLAFEPQLNGRLQLSVGERSLGFGKKKAPPAIQPAVLLF